MKTTRRLAAAFEAEFSSQTPFAYDPVRSCAIGSEITCGKAKKKCCKKYKKKGKSNCKSCPRLLLN